MAPAERVKEYAAIPDRKRRTYAAMVTALDDAISRIRGALEKSGAMENTLIVFHSDNGGQTQQGAVNLPLREGKSTVFEGGIRVPARLHAPNVLPKGHRSEQVMTNLDIFPTLAACGWNQAETGGAFRWPQSMGCVERKEGQFARGSLLRHW